MYNAVNVKEIDMTQTGFIAAIDLGTSKIKGVIGRKSENGIVSILGYQEIPSNNCIRRGIIHNMEETGSNVRKLIDFLEKKTGKKIGHVYVSLNGQSLYSTNIRELKQFVESGVVTQEDVNKLRASADSFKPDFKTIYDIADVEYFVDSKSEKNPIGVACSLLEADFKAIVGRPNLSGNIKNVIESKTDTTIADFIIGPLATAAATLTEEEKELGCALIDFGAGTTTLSIYKDDLLRYMVVIPFGGRNITKDICELNFTEVDAEQYKTKYGKAKEKKEPSTNKSFFPTPFSMSSAPKIDINLEELNNVIVLRLDEITANIKEQIEQSGYRGKLGAGLVITGGASQLKNLDIYLEEKLDMKLRKAATKKTAINNSAELVNDPSFTQMLGMLILAEKDCEWVEQVTTNEEDTTQFEDTFETTPRGKKSVDKLREMVNKKNEKKQEKPKGTFSKTLGDIFNNLFSEENDE